MSSFMVIYNINSHLNSVRKSRQEVKMFKTISNTLKEEKHISIFGNNPSSSNTFLINTAKDYIINKIIDDIKEYVLKSEGEIEIFLLQLGGYDNLKYGGMFRKGKMKEIKNFIDK